MFDHKLKFLINSNTKNFEVTFPKLIESYPSHISNQDILVVVGNSDKVAFTVCEKYCKLEVKHNSVDYTCLIALIENHDLISKHFVIPQFWFYLHDTCVLGKDFIPKLTALVPSITKNKSVTLFPSMNLGIYQHSFLFQEPAKSKLLSKRSSDNPPYEEVYKLKCGCVSDEDFLFKIENDIPFTGIVKGVTLTRPQSIYNGAKRITEYYEVLDLYKYKANWNGISPRDKVSRYQLDP
jgi:hypothetical protein